MKILGYTFKTIPLRCCFTGANGVHGGIGDIFCMFPLHMLYSFMPTKTRTMKMTRKYTIKMGGGGFRRPLATTSSCVILFYRIENGPLMLRNIGGPFSNARPVRGQKLVTALLHLRMALNTGGNDFQSLLCKAFFL